MSKYWLILDTVRFPNNTPYIVMSDEEWNNEHSVTLMQTCEEQGIVRACKSMEEVERWLRCGVMK